MGTEHVESEVGRSKASASTDTRQKKMWKTEEKSRSDLKRNKNVTTNTLKKCLKHYFGEITASSSSLTCDLGSSVRRDGETINPQICPEWRHREDSWPSRSPQRDASCRKSPADVPLFAPSSLLAERFWGLLPHLHLNETPRPAVSSPRQHFITQARN